MRRIYGFDFLRVFLVVNIILYHARIIATWYLAVDCFFVLSGFLLASSFFKKQNTNLSVYLPEILKRRFLRIYPEYLFATILTGIVYYFIFQKNLLYNIFYNLLMMSNIGNFINIVEGGWYVSVLFWCSFIYLILMSYVKEKSCFLIAPIIFMFGSVILYSQLHNLRGMGKLYNSVLCFGFIRGFVGLSWGMILYYFCSSIYPNLPTLKKYFKTSIIICTEIFSVFFIIFLFSQRHMSVRDFNIYLPISLFIFIFYNKEEFLLRFVRWNKWCYLNNFVYMTFLTNVLVIKILNKYCPTVMNLNAISKGLFVCVICIFFGAICYYLQKFFFAKLKQILFVPQPTQSA